VQAAAGWQIAQVPILGDAAYGINTELRTGLHDAGLTYVLSIDTNITIFDPDTEFTVPARTSNKGRAPTKLVANRPARSVGAFVCDLQSEAYEQLVYRDTAGDDDPGLVSRFACQRVIVAHPVLHDSCEPREEWLIIEWPESHDEPTDYWLSNLPADTPHEELARLARLRWMIELDYKQLKGHLGLDH